MSRLSCTFKRFIQILLAHGFKEVRHNGTSHRRYRGEVGGEIRLVTVAYHNVTDHILPDTLASMIRQSGLKKKLFRN
ncbi:type II toxin-antitoxin system HicA family toxin [Maricaulis sp.]|uniref:type II toxin-antitoxin system HicA family toxin n=1 Tax=Maricaulis sp. TaxID=1486257 RepID=UPI003A91E732